MDSFNQKTRERLEKYQRDERALRDRLAEGPATDDRAVERAAARLQRMVSRWRLPEATMRSIDFEWVARELLVAATMTHPAADESERES